MIVRGGVTKKTTKMSMKELPIKHRVRKTTIKVISLLYIDLLIDIIVILTQKNSMVLGFF